MRSAQVLVFHSGMILRRLLPEKLKNFRIGQPGNGRRRESWGHMNILPPSVVGNSGYIIGQPIHK
jgi:hypothetical protein